MEMRTAAVGMMLAGVVFGSSACGASPKTIDLNASDKPVLDQLVNSMSCSNNDTITECAKSVAHVTYTLKGNATSVMSPPELDFVVVAVTREGRPTTGEDTLPGFCPKSVAGCAELNTGDTVTVAFRMDSKYSTHGQAPQLDQLHWPALVVQSISKQ